MKDEHRKFAVNLLFMPPKKAWLQAIRECNPNGKNLYSSNHVYAMAKRTDVREYQAAFRSRLNPFIEVVREQLKDFEPKR